MLSYTPPPPTGSGFSRLRETRPGHHALGTDLVCTYHTTPHHTTHTWPSTSAQYTVYCSSFPSPLKQLFTWIPHNCTSKKDYICYLISSSPSPFNLKLHIPLASKTLDTFFLSLNLWPLSNTTQNIISRQQLRWEICIQIPVSHWLNHYLTSLKISFVIQKWMSR